MDVILGDIENINFNLNVQCYMRENGKLDNVGEQHK